MSKKNRIKRFPAVLAGVLFLLTGVLKLLIPFESSTGVFAYVCGNIIYFGIIFCWGIYVERSILSKKIRQLMLAIVFFMLMYVTAGVSKHLIFLDGNVAGRFLWYLYYVPQIFGTFLAFTVAYTVGKKEEHRLPKIFYALTVFAAVITVLYLTNDIHQLAFRFNLDFVAWDQQYGWGPLFYVSTLWIYFFLIAAVVLLAVKCSAVNKKKAWIPVFWLVLGSLYIFCDYFLDLWDIAPFNLPETHCFILIAMLESSMRIGIMPSNSAYGEIVSKSSAAFQIADNDNNVIYHSDNAVVLEKKQMEESKKGIIYIDENTLLLSNQIRGGYVFWTEDITAVNEMNEELAQISQRLSEQGDLIRAENEIREQRAKIAEQTRLCDSIAELVSPELEEISRLIEADGDFLKNMAHICILNCYVKRRANLTLLKDRKPSFNSDELYLSLKESAEYIRLYGGVADIYTDMGQEMSSELILLCFDLWQNMVEELLPGLYAISAKISFRADCFKFRITADGNKQTDAVKRFSSVALRLGAALEETDEEGTVYVTLTVKGGEAL